MLDELRRQLANNLPEADKLFKAMRHANVNEGILNLSVTCQAAQENIQYDPALKIEILKIAQGLDSSVRELSITSPKSR